MDTNIAQIKWIQDIENFPFVLSAYECQCGFHFAVDCTYLDQVGDVMFDCPSCHRKIVVEAYDD